MAKRLLEVYDRVIARQKERRENPDFFVGYAWCIPELNDIIGPVEPGWDVRVSAEAKVGKTSFMVSQAIAFMRQGASLVWFLLEETEEQTAIRIISNVSGVERRKFRDMRMTDLEWTELLELREVLAEFDMHFEEMATLEDVEEVLKVLDPDVVVIDYMQLVSVNKRYDSRTQEMSEVSRGLKRLTTKERPCGRRRVLLTAVQLNDDGKFLWSRDPGRDADIVLRMKTVYDPAGIPQANKAKLEVTLSRHSRFGDEVTVYINLGRSLVSGLIDTSIDLNERLQAILSAPYGEDSGPQAAGEEQQSG